MFTIIIKAVALAALLSTAIACPQGQRPIKSSGNSHRKASVQSPSKLQGNVLANEQPSLPGNSSTGLQPELQSSPQIGSQSNPQLSPQSDSQSGSQPNSQSNPSPNAQPDQQSGSPPISQPNSQPNSQPDPQSGSPPIPQSNSPPNAQPNPKSPPVSNSQPATELCGNDQKIILDGTPWLVANSMYGAGSMVGTSCTHYDHVETGAGGNSQVVWSSTVDIQKVGGTDNICKGYANVGLIGNLENSISSMSSVPASYQWTRTNKSPFKGNICFDFIISNAKGDSTSGAAVELMLWLQWDGDQLPIGWDAGPTATVPGLFGTSWKIYEGPSPNNGMKVYSLLPDTQFGGSFSGDLKNWFMALVKLGKFTDATFVNIGNGGSEIFWGNSVLQASLGVQINLN